VGTRAQRAARRRPVPPRASQTGGRVSSTGEEQGLCVLDPLTGAPRWTRFEDDAFSVAADPERVVLTPTSGRVVGLDRASGAPLWESAVEGTWTGAYLLGGLVVAVSILGVDFVPMVVVLDAATGDGVARDPFDAAASGLVELSAHPCPGGACVAASRPGRLTLLRFQRA
jgi:hypothetical protein